MDKKMPLMLEDIFKLCWQTESASLVTLDNLVILEFAGNVRFVYLCIVKQALKNITTRKYMRIILKTSPNSIPVPFDYQSKLVGCIQKWLGADNDYHGKISLYSFSWLQEGKLVGGSLSFPLGARLFVSFYDDDAVKDIIRSILGDPAMFCGMSVTDITLADMPDFAGRDLFFCGSPILIKRRMEDGSCKQFNYQDSEANELMTETLLTKMREVGLEEDKTLDIRFDTSYGKKKLKLVHYRSIGNKASLCPVIIHAKPATKQFAWEVGIGNSTGIGFGAIY